jgi:hypothetical protein
MNTADAEFHATVKQYNELAKRNISQEDLKKYVKVVFDIKDPAKSKKVLPDVMALFEYVKSITDHPIPKSERGVDRAVDGGGALFMHAACRDRREVAQSDISKGKH